MFRNISKIIDCVSCQKCKLHGKLALLGVGTALKILLLPDRLIASTIQREEVVALLNTVGKFSQAIDGIKNLQVRKFTSSRRCERVYNYSLRKSCESIVITSLVSCAPAATIPIPSCYVNRGQATCGRPVVLPNMTLCS